MYPCVARNRNTRINNLFRPRCSFLAAPHKRNKIGATIGAPAATRGNNEWNNAETRVDRRKTRRNGW